MATDTRNAELDNGLRILARMIARAYLKEVRAGQSKTNDSESKSKETEEEDANQRSERSCEITETGENKAGDKEGKC